MSVTVLSDVVMPTSVIAAGIRGRQIRQNKRTANQAGFSTVNIVWTKTLREYDLGVVPMLVSQWEAIEGLHEVTEGGAYGFLMPDPKDNAVTATNGVASLVSGNVYQLAKRYTSLGSSRTKDRTITRPIAAGFALYLSGVLQSGGSYTLDSNTGRITIPSAPSAANISWAGSFYVPVQFQSDVIDWEMVRSGQFDQRLIAGPTVALVEVRE